MADAVKFFEHPDYLAKREYWETAADLYDGDHDTLVTDRYLWRHEFESSNLQTAGTPAEGYSARGAGLLRSIRERRSQYINRLRAVLRRYVAIMFINEMDLSAAQSLFDEETGEIDDVDGNGTSFTDYLKAAADLYFRDGRVFGIVDSYSLTLKNQAQEKEAGARPFLSLLNALEVKDWEIETQNPARRGQYNMLRDEYAAVLPRSSLTEVPVQKLYCRIHAVEGGTYTISRYVGPTLNGAIVTQSKDAQWQLEEVAPIALDALPIAAMESSRPLVADVVPLCLLRHNTQSSLDNGLMFQAHQRILAAGNFKPGEGLVMNEGVVTLIPEGSNVTVVEPSNPVALKERLAGLDAEIIQVGFLKERAIPLDSKEIQAADSQAEGNRDFLAEMKRAAKEMAQFATQTCKNWAAFKGQEFNEEIKIDDDFTQEDINEQVQILTSMWDTISLYPLWSKEELKKLATQRNLSNIEEVLKEIDAKEVEKPVDRLALMQQSMKEAGQGKDDSGGGSEEPGTESQARE